MTRLEALELQLMAAEKPVCFKSFFPEVQERFQRASDYADMFVELKNTAGKPVAWMAAYYLCRSTHGIDTPCNTIIFGKTWSCKYAEDPLDPPNVSIAIFAKRNITRISGCSSSFSNDDHLHAGSGEAL